MVRIFFVQSFTKSYFLLNVKSYKFLSLPLANANTFK